ncbi:bifunctional hydroxymethylpyrimidine kinase/phosphomethylpyrimidine kinase [Mariniluteicoccus endophyticus]
MSVKPSPSPRPQQPVALTIAGNDPSGGAGIVRDLRTFEQAGAWGCAVITALTAQSPGRVTGVHAVPPEFVDEQLRTLLDDCRVDAVKVGMLAAAPLVEVVIDWFSRVPLADVPRVVDPVMVSTSGARLLDEDATAAMRRLVPLASIITPNLPEAGVLLGAPEATSLEEMYAQAQRLRDELGAPLVLLKGGHLAGLPEAVDVLAGPDGTHEFRAPWVRGTSTRGTGCTLSSALAAHRVQSPDWPTAVERAKASLDL